MNISEGSVSASNSMIENSIRAALKVEIEKATAIIIKDTKLDFERKIAEIVASVSVGIMKHVSFETMRNELVIRVKLDGSKQ